MEEKELKAVLLKKSKEFRKAFDLHQKCERKLGKLEKKGYLTEEERLEEKELKKKKLALKDKMYFLMAEYRKSLL